MKIIIGADVVPTAATEKYFVCADMPKLFGDVVKITKSADRVIVNLECALTECEEGIAKFGPNLKASPKCTEALKALGVTEVALSNNHTFDFGIKGFLDTTSALDAAGLPSFGYGENDTASRKPYFIEAEGKRIAIINVCEHEYSYATPDRLGANPFDPFLTMQDIRAAKEVSDFVIVLYHGGKEYCRYPSPRLYNLCHEMVLCGADVVLTQHSHCIGCYEQFEGGHIVYGQGNFNFVFAGYDCPECWYTSLLVELDIEDGVKIKFHPLVATEAGCDIAKGEAAEKIMSEFEARNAELLNGKWREGWHAFCTQPDLSYYHDSVREAKDTDKKLQVFAHYLDCEAHTDVWRELYPTWNATNELDAE